MLFFTSLSARCTIRVCSYWHFSCLLIIFFFCACVVYFYWFLGMPNIVNFILLITVFYCISTNSVLLFYLSYSYLGWVQSNFLSKANLSQHHNDTFLWILPNVLYIINISSFPSGWWEHTLLSCVNSRKFSDYLFPVYFSHLSITSSCTCARL